MTAETELPAYLPYPRFLLKMDISHTAKLLYALLLDRSTLSQKNGWQDSEGRTYIVYPIAEIAEMLDKGCTTIKGALNELDAAGLLERRRAGFSCANRLYVKVPDIPVVQFSDQLTDGKPPLIRAGNRPTDSRKTDLMTVGKPSPNQTNINNLRIRTFIPLRKLHISSVFTGQVSTSGLKKEPFPPESLAIAGEFPERNLRTGWILGAAERRKLNGITCTARQPVLRCVSVHQ